MFVGYSDLVMSYSKQKKLLKTIKVNVDAFDIAVTYAKRQ